MKSVRNFVVLMISLVVVSRLVPHPPNFTSISAVAIFSIHQMQRNWIATFITFFSLWVSDLIINNVVLPFNYPSYYDGFKWFSSVWIYAAYTVILAFLSFFLKRENSKIQIFATGIFSALLIFFITNFGVWIGGTLYPNNLNGLIMSYFSGLPFLLNSVLGNLFYLGVLFGSKAFLEKYVHEKS